MLCQICLRAAATIHVLDRPPDDPQINSHYCAACHERAYAGRSIGRVVEDDVPPPFLSRPRFTIRHLMIAAGLSGFLDAFLVLFIRLGGPGAPAEIDEWTMRAVLFGNVFCAGAIALILAFRWLARWHWYATTGRWLTFRQMMRDIERMQRAGVRTNGRPASAGEWFFWALGVAWLLLWICGLKTDGLPAWVDSRASQYGIEAVFTYILILPAGELPLYFGMVAAALRRVARERPEAGPPGRIPEETGNDRPERCTPID